MFYWIEFDRLKEQFLFTPGDPLLFTSSLFLFSFFVLLVFYRIFNSSKNIRIFTLLIFSLFFYYKAAGYYAAILIVSALLNYVAGALIFRQKTMAQKRTVLVTAIILNVAAIGYFKYTNFILQIVADLSAGKFEPLDIFLPIGISFYTFKAMSYLIDIYYEFITPVKSFRDFSLFIFFFPNLLIGPIDRASKFLPQIESEPILTKEDFGKAVFLLCSGLIKKGVIADYISFNFVDRVFDVPLRFTGVENLLAVYAYALQIFCDFSGYTDMALGIALLLGFKLMDNFNWPFKANNIAEFWRRWHISLSTWFLDYFFKPLQMIFRDMRMAGNALALFLTFVVIGIWHGASWMYIVFGLIHGAYISISLLTQKYRKNFYTKIGIVNSKWLKAVQILITFHLVCFSWIFFRAPNFEIAFNVLEQIFTRFHIEVLPQFISGYQTIIGMMIIGFTLHFITGKWAEFLQSLITRMPLLLKATVLALVIWLVIQAKSADIQPFLYFQF